MSADAFDPPSESTPTRGAGIAFAVLLAGGLAPVVLLGLADAGGPWVAAAGLGLGIAVPLAAIALGWRTPWAVGILILSLATSTWWAIVGALLAMVMTVSFSRGRQLRRGAKLLLPPVGEGAAWAAEGEPVDVPSGLRSELADRWRENGRTEHASVAAFARTSLELVALGAPPQLLDDAAVDARDEIRHAEACFRLARQLDGRAASPSAFPAATTAGAARGTRTMRLVSLAVTSLIDGALHEGLSARVVARMAKRCEVPAIRTVLTDIARDEARHAAHGWDVVAWCVQEGGAPVRAALRGAMRAVPTRFDSGLRGAGREGGHEPYGLHGHATEAAEYDRARTRLARRVERLAT